MTVKLLTIGVDLWHVIHTSHDLNWIKFTTLIAWCSENLTTIANMKNCEVLLFFHQCILNKFYNNKTKPYIIVHCYSQEKNIPQTFFGLNECKIVNYRSKFMTCSTNDWVNKSTCNSHKSWLKLIKVYNSDCLVQWKSHCHSKYEKLWRFDVLSPMHILLNLYHGSNV